MIGTRPDLVRIYGKVQAGGDVGVWNYPSSSTQDLVRLYRAEQGMVDMLHTVIKEMEMVMSNVRTGGQGWRCCEADHGLSEATWPRVDHFIAGSGLGLVQIQALYSLSMDMVVMGDILGYRSLHQLSGEDCVFLASTARSLGRLDAELDWLEAAEKAVEGVEKQTAVKEKLDDLRLLHDKLLLEQGYDITHPGQRLVSEGATPIITKMIPQNNSLSQDPRLVKHREKIKNSSSSHQFLNKNNPDLYFYDQHLPARMHNMLYRENPIMKELCMGSKQRSP